MKGRKWNVSALLLVCLFSLIALGGCGGGSDEKAEALKKWEGNWTSLARFVTDPVMNPVYAKVYEGVSPDYTAEGLKDYFEHMFQTDFDGMTITGDSVTFMDGSKVLGSARYQSKGDGKTAMEEEFSLFQMVEGSASKPEGSQFDPNSVKFFALPSSGPETQFEGGILRVPVRYSGESLKEMMEGRPSWMATFGKEGTTAEDVRKELDHNVTLFIPFLSTMLRPFTDWQGAWTSAVTFLDDPAMTEVYKTIAEKAVAKGKKTNTPDAVKGAFKAMLNSDFGGMKLEGNTAAILNADGTVKENLSYVYAGTETRKYSEYPLKWTLFEAKSAGGYKYLVLLPQEHHGTGPVHFHMRYGDTSAAALLDTPALQGWFPTLCKEGTTVAIYAANMLQGADEMVEMLP